MKLFYFLDDDVDETKPKVDSLSSGYPTEELMERFAEIVKGRTYLHRPNQSLNLYLTAALAVSFFMVIGLGFGHFKGKKTTLQQFVWSTLLLPTIKIEILLFNFTER